MTAMKPFSGLTDNPLPAAHASAILTDGRRVHVWHDVVTGRTLPSCCLRARIMHADNTPAGPDFVVTTLSEGDCASPAVIPLTDGRFVIRWLGAGLDDPSAPATRAQLFNTDGTRAGAEFAAPL